MPLNLTEGLTGNFVLSQNGTRLYLAGADGAVRVYDTQTGGLLAEWDVGNNLGAIDISPDGTFLLITEQVPVASAQSNDWTSNTTTSAVYKVDTTTGAFQTVTYESTGSDYVLADVAITSGGTAIFTENILPGWSGWTPQVILDLDTLTFTKSGPSYYQAGSVTAAPDDATVLFGQLYLSSAEARIFSPDGTSLANNGIYENGVYGYAQGIEAYSGAGDSGRVAISTGGALHLWNGNFGYIANLTQAYPQLESIVGVQFSADGSTLYALSASSDRIFLISMADLTIKLSVPIGDYDATVSSWGDELVLSPDGQYVFMRTTDGIIRGDLPNVATGTPNQDTFSGTDRVDYYAALASNDAMSGGGGDDVLDGGAGADDMRGDAGNDALIGGPGGDTMRGGTGDDVYLVDDGGDVVLELAGQGTDSIYTSVGFVLASGSAVETLTVYDRATTGTLSLYGNELGQAIYGNNGANLLSGGGGADTLFGMGGNDAYFIDGTGDVVFEFAGSGYDVVYTTGSFELSYSSAVELITVEDRSTTNAVTLWGNALNQTLYANAGDNFLNGGGGADVLYGFAGSDSYLVDSLSDQVVELAGQGLDTVYAAASFTLSQLAEVEVLSALDRTTGDALDLVGSAYGQTIYGTMGVNFLDGNGGADVIYGLGGDDSYLVDGLEDQVFEFAGQGTDTVYAAGHFVLTAGSEVEVLSVYDRTTTEAINLAGNELANTIYGNNGANVIDGKGGADAIHLLAGADAVYFSTPLGAGNVDTVAGFVSGEDKLLLDSVTFAGLAPGALAADAFVVNALPADANDRLLYNETTGQLFFDADGNGAGAAELFAMLDPGTVLNGNDFAVV